jgi:hypothetical protein
MYNINSSKNIAFVNADVFDKDMWYSIFVNTDMIMATTLTPISIDQTPTWLGVLQISDH